MKHKDHIRIVPPQFTGQEIETEATKMLHDETEAKNLYAEAKKKLLDVNNWKEIAGAMTAQFHFNDEQGKEVNREVKKVDYLRLDIPGPGNKGGDRYDWVVVEELRHSSNGSVKSVGFRGRTNESPGSEENETAHYYSKE